MTYNHEKLIATPLPDLAGLTPLDKSEIGSFYYVNNVKVDSLDMITWYMYYKNKRYLSTLSLCYESDYTGIIDENMQFMATYYEVSKRNYIRNQCIDLNRLRNRYNSILIFGLELFIINAKHTLKIYYDAKFQSQAQAFQEKFIALIQSLQTKDEKEKNKNVNKIQILGLNEETKFPLTPFHIDVASNYNDDFLPVNEYIIDRLSNKRGKGLVLLHGLPGTGKTTYIRYLTRKINKPLFFIPNSIAHNITNNRIIQLILKHPDSIFVIEDAEELIVSRETGNLNVNGLLSLTDGLLSDVIGTQIICTFNTDLHKIDEALLRKGRLIARYEFKELETEKANQLAAKLGLEPTFTSPVALTDVYNLKKEKYRFDESRVQGFTLQ